MFFPIEGKESSHLVVCEILESSSLSGGANAQTHPVSLWSHNIKSWEATANTAVNRVVSDPIRCGLNHTQSCLYPACDQEDDLRDIFGVVA